MPWARRDSAHLAAPAPASVRPAAPPAAAPRPRLRRVAAWLAGAAAVAALAWFLFAPRPLPVETATVALGPLAVTVDNQGLVRAHDVYTVAAPVAGELERSPLRDGDTVRAGAVVAMLRPVPLDLRQRQQAQAQLDAARALASEADTMARRSAADLRQAASEHTRQARLVADGFVSAQALERATTAEHMAHEAAQAARFRLQAAQADVRAASAALAAAEGAKLLPLHAPVDGQVLRVLERSRRTVAAGTPLLTIGDPRRYEFVADVLSSDAVRIHSGDLMWVEGWGGAVPLQARVRLVEPVAFTKVSALGVEEQRVNVVADPVGTVAPLGDGYRIEVRVVVWSTPRTLKLPGSALFRVRGGWHVFVLDEGRLRERAVAVGQRNQDEAQVLSGLAAGERVVRFPANQMRDGMHAQASAESGG
ncbi:MAG: efflux RND transporter periplasmic adaptor subunit [Telluria sp.]